MSKLRSANWLSLIFQPSSIFGITHLEPHPSTIRFVFHFGLPKTPSPHPPNSTTSPTPKKTKKQKTPQMCCFGFLLVFFVSNPLPTLQQRPKGHTEQRLVQFLQEKSLKIGWSHRGLPTLKGKEGGRVGNGRQHPENKGST